MTIVIPMAGIGYRFVEAGYEDPKPLIKVGGRRMIDAVVSMFDPFSKFIFICNDTHIETTRLKAHIETIPIHKKPVIVSMPQHKLGPVFSVMAACEHIPDDDEVIVSYCDGIMPIDVSALRKKAADMRLDGCWITHTGFHPHTLSSTKMAFMMEKDGLAVDVKEKSSYTNNPMNEHASSGVYYFRTGALLKKYCDKAVANGVSYNGEFYVTLVFKPMIEDGLRVSYFDTQFVAILGTPHEVQNFEAWLTIVKNPYLRTEADVLMCYNYWRQYTSTNPAL